MAVDFSTTPSRGTGKSGASLAREIGLIGLLWASMGSIIGYGFLAYALTLTVRWASDHRRIVFAAALMCVAIRAARLSDGSPRRTDSGAEAVPAAQ
mgnify:CR=1 FL=1